MTLGVSNLDCISWAFLLLVSPGVTHVATATWWCHGGWVVWDGLTHIAGRWCGLLAGLLSLCGLSSSRKLVRARSPDSVRAARGHARKLQGLWRSRLQKLSLIFPDRSPWVVLVSTSSGLPACPVLPSLEHIPLDLDCTSSRAGGRFSLSPGLQPAGSVGCNELNERERRGIGGLDGRGTEGESKD